MVDKDKIMRLLEEYFTTTGTVTIDDRGLASCTGNVTLKKEKKWDRLPVAFDRVDGSFLCYLNQLQTLEGAPKSVGRDFWCNDNQLTTLEGAPKSVSRNFECSRNLLTTLEHAPQSVGGSFGCTTNKLTTLEGAPENVDFDFMCDDNKLTSLEHAPKTVGGDFGCASNLLTSLEHAPKSVGGSFGCRDNPLESLEGLPTVPGTLYLSYSPTLPLLRCLLAQKVEIENEFFESILNKYAGKGEAGAFLCGAELVDAGYKENARW